jgi:hypothetical protein
MKSEEVNERSDQIVAVLEGSILPFKIKSTDECHDAEVICTRHDDNGETFIYILLILIKDWMSG